MEYVFYADVFWLQNSLMNGIILLTAEKVRKIPYRRCAGRTLLSAGAGGLAETVLIIVLGNYRLYRLCSLFLILPFLVFLAFGKEQRGVFRKNLLLCYGISVLLGGFVQALENLTGFRRSLLLSGILGGLFAAAGIGKAYRDFQRQRRLFPVELTNGECRVCCEGLWDSGNLLRQPGKDAPVHIVSPEVMRQLQIRKEDCIGVLPYRALGTECGILKIYRIDEVAVFDSGGTKRAHPAVVAEAGEGLLTNRRYQMIVNPGIMESW